MAECVTVSVTALKSFEKLGEAALQSSGMDPNGSQGSGQNRSNVLPANAPIDNTTLGPLISQGMATKYSQGMATNYSQGMATNYSPQGTAAN